MSLTRPALPLLASCLLLLTACSDSDHTDLSAMQAASGDAYLSLNLTISGTKTPTRAVTFPEGTTGENDVKDAILVLLKAGENTTGASAGEDDAIITKAYAIDNTFDATTPTDQTYSDTRYVLKINRADVGLSDAYALVLINSGGKYWVDKDHNLRHNQFDDLYSSETVSGKTFGWFKDNQRFTIGTPSSTIPAGGLFMTNAPVCSMPGGSNNPTGGTITTLAKLDMTKIYDNEADAQATVAANIFVERAAAKVEVKGANTLGGTTNGPAEQVNYDKDGIRWLFDIYNTEGYTVRHMPASVIGLKASGAEDDYQYRMVSSSPWQSGATSAYRTFWAEDINFNSANDLESFYADYNNELTDAEKDAYRHPMSDATFNAQFKHSLGDYVYCAENTIDQDNLRQDRTTRIVMAVQFYNDQVTLGNDFYSFATHPNRIYNKQAALNMLARELFRKDSGGHYANEFSGRGGDFIAFWREWFIDTGVIALDDFYPKSEDIPTDDSPITSGVITLSLLEDAASGACYLELDFDMKYLKAEYRTTEKWESAKDEINTAFKEITLKQGVRCYKSGWAYYPIRIKHFGDLETPWIYAKETEGYDDIYPTDGAGRQANYLGRYSVVRNNWYEITVTGINLVGSNVMPQPKDTDPDDTPNNWLSYIVNVMPWAGRAQEFKFE